MAGEAKQTYIQDAEGAANSLATMAAHAELLKEKIAGLITKISDLESGKPWGQAPEYGGAFEKMYHAGAGATFVKENVGIITTETVDGVTVANAALHGAVDLDKEIAGAFKVDGSEAAGKGMTGTLTGISDLNKEQH